MECATVTRRRSSLSRRDSGGRPDRREISDLVCALDGADPVRQESLKEQIIACGTGAVDTLVRALDSEKRSIRTIIIYLLSQIREPRAREPIVSQLHDQDPGVREAAARALALLPCGQSIQPLERLVRQDPQIEVRITAARTLVDLFQAGFEEGVGTLIATLYDTGADRRLRIAALSILPLLRGRERQDMVRHLRDEKDPEIASRARLLEGASGKAGTPDEQAIRRALRDLASASSELQDRALGTLIEAGVTVIQPLVQEMLWRYDDAEYCRRAGRVLRGLGARQLRPVAEYLEILEEPNPLEVIVDALGWIEDKRHLYRLKDLIDRLGRLITREPGDLSAQGLERVRAKAHLQLAKIGSRVAIADLKETLRSPVRKVHVEHLLSVARIGKQEELADLLHAFGKEEPWMRERIRQVFQDIKKRERIRLTSRLFASYTAEENDALRELLSRPRSPDTRDTTTRTNAPGKRRARLGGGRIDRLPQPSR